jgi:hypothetical protein
MLELPLTKSKRSTRDSRIRIQARLSRNYERQECERSGLQLRPHSAWSAVPLIGANCVFVANPDRFLIVVLAILQWKARNER